MADITHWFYSPGRTVVSRMRCGWLHGRLPLPWILPVIALWFLLSSPILAAADAPAMASPPLAQCLYVSSYHAGYEWNDGIEAGLTRALAGRCELQRFYMDTKRDTRQEQGEQKALEAKALIDRTRPDIVIAADDNVSRYLVSRYFRDADIPFVFCGVNWTVQEYGYPYRNVTGMIEVAPIRPTLKVIHSVVRATSRGVYLSSDVFTEHKDFERYQRIFAAANIRLEGVFVSTLEDWREAYLAAQGADFVILGNNAGINDWDPGMAGEHALRHAGAFSVTNYDWMMPYAMFAMTKLPDEQGEWAGQVALAILDGTPPLDIPIVANRRWGLYANPELLTRAGIKLPDYLMHKSVKVSPP